MRKAHSQSAQAYWRIPMVETFRETSLHGNAPIAEAAVHIGGQSRFVKRLRACLVSLQTCAIPLFLHPFRVLFGGDSFTRGCALRAYPGLYSCTLSACG